MKLLIFHEFQLACFLRDGHEARLADGIDSIVGIVPVNKSGTDICAGHGETPCRGPKVRTCVKCTGRAGRRRAIWATRKVRTQLDHGKIAFAEVYLSEIRNRPGSPAGVGLRTELDEHLAASAYRVVGQFEFSA